MIGVNEQRPLPSVGSGALGMLLKGRDTRILVAIALILAAGILLLLWPKSQSSPVPPAARLVDSPSGGSARTDSETIGVAEEMGRQMEELLSQVAGAGKVTVSIRLETEGEARYSANSRLERRRTDEKGQDGLVRSIDEETRLEELVMEKTARGEELPVMSGKTAPVVAGAVIVAEGASVDAVRLALARAAASILDIPLYRVVVLAREGGE